MARSTVRAIVATMLTVGIHVTVLQSPASAATTEVISPGDVTTLPENTPPGPGDEWVKYLRPTAPGTATFMTGPGTPPLGAGSVQLSTPTAAHKVQLFNFEHIGTPLSDIGAMTYWTYRTAAPLPTSRVVAAINLQVDFNGPSVAGGFTTLVYEPVNNVITGQPATVPVSNLWQQWDAIRSGNARWWSTQAIGGQCAGQSACIRTWSFIVANNPNAVILGGVGLNQGTSNAGIVDAVDAFTFDDVTYDFELTEDSDGDGVQDSVDNCPSAFNPAPQADQDTDGVGDACDPDIDGDEVANGDDNCATTPNADQLDLDDDGAGDACDGDVDGDAVANGDDNCPTAPNPGQEDLDGDTVGDACDPDIDGDGLLNASDNCAGTANPGQEDQDGDTVGDACDPDVDGDGFTNATDNCPSTANADQADLDDDGAGDACDPDIDGDTVVNGDDNCPTTANADQADLDGDNVGDACDSDVDGDGVENGPDNCPTTPNPSQTDFDNDGLGTACDDANNDGIDDTPPPVTKDECKNDGWRAFNNPSFRNQGDCVAYVTTSGRNPPSG